MQNHVYKKRKRDQGNAQSGDPARGEIANLEGRGKPLDLDAYFNTPERLANGLFYFEIEQASCRRKWRFQEIADLKQEFAASMRP